MDSIIAVTVAALALVAPHDCRPPAPLPTEGALFPAEGLALPPPPREPRKPRITLYSDEGKLWTKYPNKKHLVEILPLRHKSPPQGKALAYILPKNNRKQLQFQMIQDLSDDVSGSEGSSYEDLFDGTSIESEDELVRSSAEPEESKAVEELVPAETPVNDNPDDIITNKINDIVAFFKEHSNVSGDVTTGVLEEEHPDHHVHYITHSTHHGVQLNHHHHSPEPTHTESASLIVHGVDNIHGGNHVEHFPVEASVRVSGEDLGANSIMRDVVVLVQPTPVPVAFDYNPFEAYDTNAKISIQNENLVESPRPVHTHDPTDLGLGEILEIISEGLALDHAQPAPLPIPDSSTDRDSEHSLSEQIVLLPTPVPYNSNSAESESSSVSEGSDSDEFNDAVDDVSVADVTNDTIESSGSDESGCSGGFVLPDCFRKKKCKGHNSYKLTFLFNG